MENVESQTVNKTARKSHWKEIFLPVFLIVFFGAAIFGVYLLKNYLTEPPLLEVNLPESSQTIDERVTIVGETDKEAILKINDQEIEINNDGGFSHEFDLQTGENKIFITAENKASKITKVERKIEREEIVTITETLPESEAVLGTDTFTEDQMALSLIETQTTEPVMTEDLSTSGPKETLGVIGITFVILTLGLYRKSRKTTAKIGQAGYKLFTN